ncbi:MAG: guanylate kinase [Lachnospiraceae bacterium]|nr:guanylate kinase [Lachnospiraceae bacterium]
MQSKGILMVVSGFAGVGKGTVIKELLSTQSQYTLSVSATTRAPRPGEVDGVNYFFRTREEFEQMIHENGLIEHAEYVGNYYGTPKAYVEEQLNLGKNVILEIEIQGAMNIKKQFPEAVLIFILPPDAKTLKERLVGRGTETMEVIEKRMNRACQEAEGIEEYDYVVVNDEVPQCAMRIHEIIEAEKAKAKKNLSLIESIRNGLKNL